MLCKSPSTNILKVMHTVSLVMVIYRDHISTRISHGLADNLRYILKVYMPMNMPINFSFILQYE